MNQYVENGCDVLLFFVSFAVNYLVFEMYSLDQMEGCYDLRFQMVETPTLPKQNFRVLMDFFGLGRV